MDVKNSLLLALSLRRFICDLVLGFPALPSLSTDFVVLSIELSKHFEPGCFHHVVLNAGFTKSFGDYNLFTRLSSCSLMILSFVDDTIIIYDGVSSITALKKKHLQW